MSNFQEVVNFSPFIQRSQLMLACWLVPLSVHSTVHCPLWTSTVHTRPLTTIALTTQATCYPATRSTLTLVHTLLCMASVHLSTVHYRDQFVLSLFRLLRSPVPQPVDCLCHCLGGDAAVVCVAVVGCAGSVLRLVGGVRSHRCKLAFLLCRRRSVGRRALAACGCGCQCSSQGLELVRRLGLVREGVRHGGQHRLPRQQPRTLRIQHRHRRVAQQTPTQHTSQPSNAVLPACRL